MRNLIKLIFLFIAISGNSQTNYELVWADEFDGNGAIDANNWHHQTELPAGGNWYNGEIQHYTNREINANQSNGTLKIVAKKEVYTDQGVSKQYTSARLNSKVAFTYGRVEVRAKLPFGLGTWPAIWTLGKNIIEPGAYWSSTFGTAFWPACGEIDIMEHWGANQNFVQSALHTPSSFGGTINLGGQNVNNVSTEFHTYELEWTSEEMIFSVDGIVHYIYNPPIKDANTWPFDTDQYILLNVAILPDSFPSFTEDAMEVDYVRVYQKTVLGTNDIADSDLVEFANPVDDTLRIRIPKQLTGSMVRIYNLQGRQQIGVVLAEEFTLIDTSSFASGLYIMKIIGPNGIFTKKILKN